MIYKTISAYTIQSNRCLGVFRFGLFFLAPPYRSRFGLEPAGISGFAVSASEHLITICFDSMCFVNVRFRRFPFPQNRFSGHFCEF